MSDETHFSNGGQPSKPAMAEELLSSIYDELRRLAAAKMASEAPGQTLQPTALVHEVWLRLGDDENRKWNDRTHFFATAAEAMRRILIDQARRKRTRRHGGGHQRVEMPEIPYLLPEGEDQMLAVHEALEKFAAQNPQKAELVKLRYFVGMTIDEAADALGISAPTAKRHWAYARAWLAAEIKGCGPVASRPNEDRPLPSQVV